MERLGGLLAGDLDSKLSGLHRTHLAVVAHAHTGAPGHRIRTGVAALGNRNYRLYFTGQIISVSGTWLQQTALAWTVLELAGNATDVGVVVALQFVPLLLLGPFGGVIADRHSRRKLLLCTSLASTVLAAALTAVSAAGNLTVGLAYVFALAGGFVLVVDNPARQAFAAELVAPEMLSSAIALNGVVMNSGRVVGPALAGLLIANTGVTSCFALNAASYVAVIVALTTIRPGDLQPQTLLERAPHELRDGLRYVRSHQDVLVPLSMMAVVGSVTLNFPTVLPALAENTFHGGAGTFATLSAVMSVGAVAGAAAAGTARHPNPRLVALASIAFGVGVALCAVAPTLVIELIVIVPMGAAAYAFITLAMTTVQLGADPSVRGRVMAWWALAFAGTTPIGAPAIGAVAQHFGARAALFLGAVAAVAAGAMALLWTDRQRAENPTPAGH